MPTTLNDLPDKILLKIFSYLLDEDTYTAEVPLDDCPNYPTAPRASTRDVSPSTVSKKSKRRHEKAGRKVIIAGPAARTLCRLCCCSKRLNHIASANQLWQPLTLAKFPNRHWPQTDPTKIGLVRVQRDHQQKVVNDASQKPAQDDSDKQKQRFQMSCNSGDSISHGEHGGSQSGESRGQRPSTLEATSSTATKKKFYSRFEQRAFRRKFPNLDPALEFTPLLWTNTFWNWKRTYFGDCRFLEAHEVTTPNRIDHTLYRKPPQGDGQEQARKECTRCWRPARSCICSALPDHMYCNCRVRILILQHPRCQVSIGTIRILKTCFKYCDVIIGKDFSEGLHPELDKILQDPNCQPLLLYPSHNAIDIHQLAAAQPQSGIISSTSINGSQSYNVDTDSMAVPERFFCHGCIHSYQQTQENAPEIQVQNSYSYQTIIALDGSWSHAKIMYRFNPRLQQLTNVLFLQPPRSIYHDLKPEPKATYTSTVEAVGQAVALLGWPTTPVSSQREDTTIVTAQSEKAQLLLEDLVRPLRKMIEIQDTIQLEQQQQGQVAQLPLE